MATIQQNIEEVALLLSLVTGHCMCARFDDLGGVYRVLYAPGFRFDGVQASYAKLDKAKALERMLAAMERHWND